MVQPLYPRPIVSAKPAFRKLSVSVSKRVFDSRILAIHGNAHTLVGDAGNDKEHIVGITAHFDKDQIKQAASGRWPEILSSLCGLTPEEMESRHQPCPKCQGVDRYRAFDDFEQTGGVFCNQCHNQKGGDGFGTIMWMLDCDFPEAVAKVAEYRGMAPSKTKKKSSTPKPAADPAKDLEFMPWAPLLAAHFLDAKKGITEASLLAQGCRMARYKRQFTVIAWPIIGPDLDTEKPCGYVIMDYKARRNIPRYDKKGNEIGKLDKKLTWGSIPGLIGVDGINKLRKKAQDLTVWKVEGITDLSALWAAIPEQLRDSHVVITTSNGAEDKPDWRADLIARFDVNVIHDCDQPGQKGAQDWAEYLVRSKTGKIVRNVTLPFEIVENHGKDLRDFLTNG